MDQYSCILFIFHVIHLIIYGLWLINIIFDFIYSCNPNPHHIFKYLLLVTLFFFFSLYFHLLQVLLFESMFAIFNCSSSVPMWQVMLTCLWLDIGRLPSTLEAMMVSECVAHLNLMYVSFVSKQHLLYLFSSVFNIWQVTLT